MSITIEMGLPDPALRPNGRAHWRVVAAAKKQAKGTALVLALAAGDGTKWTAAMLDVVWFAKTKRYVPDDDNAWGSLKAARDGIAAAIGIDDKHVRQGVMRMDVDKARPRVQITVRPA